MNLKTIFIPWKYKVRNISGNIKYRIYENISVRMHQKRQKYMFRLDLTLTAQYRVLKH